MTFDTSTQDSTTTRVLRVSQLFREQSRETLAQVIAALRDRRDAAPRRWWRRDDGYRRGISDAIEIVTQHLAAVDER